MKAYNWTDARIAKLGNLIGKGYKQVEIAKVFGVGIDKIRYAIEKYDLDWKWRNADDARAKRRAKLKKK